MGAALAIRDDLTPEVLRRYARHEPNRRAALRMLAIANAVEGMSRAEAARLAGMERQALRDAVVRYNAEGLAGLRDRPRPPRPGKLDEAELRLLSALILDGPGPEADGLSAWTLPELCRVIEERFAKRLHPASLSRVMRRMGFSRQKARQRHPSSDRAAQEAFQKGASPPPWPARSGEVPASRSRCGSKTKLASARRGACATAGGRAAGGHRACVTGVIHGFTCLLRCARPPATASRSSCRSSRRRR